MDILNVQDLVTAQATETIAFYLISIVAISLSLGVIADRNVIRAGFLLIGVFGGISMLFLLLQAQFLALAQIMIYAVGITLVVVIALMLTNPRLAKESDYDDGNNDKSPLDRFLAGTRNALPGLVAWLSFLTIYLAVRSEGWAVTGESVSPDNLKVLGEALTTSYSLPFEFASVLLLAALMGSIMLAKAEPVSPSTGIETVE
ncbi:MAG: NADH-quinone oxidoreductase subunit J, partial [Candidatus Obscuribacterales bacterium]|nr:NADH-quinone oxidoreductase subunit J [Candidatus Obscuribacterales bacterium]